MNRTKGPYLTPGLADGYCDVVDVENEVIEANEDNNTKGEALWIHQIRKRARRP